MKPYCETCKTKHEKWQAHVFQSPKKEEKPVDPVMRQVVRVIAKSGNRRGIEKYNGYMKAYMRVWRAVKAGRAEWLRRDDLSKT